MKKKRTLSRLVSWLDEWVSEPSRKQQCFANSIAAMTAYLSQNTEPPFVDVANYGFWRGKIGAKRQLEGLEDGWWDLQTALQGLAISERILFEMLIKKTAHSIGIQGPIFVLLHAMATGSDSIAHWFGTRLIDTVKLRRKQIDGWEAAPVYLFALYLYAKWRDFSLDFSGGKVLELAVYKEILDAWNSENEFARMMQKACEYHLYQAFDDSDNDTQDFCYKFYDLFPVEIHAIARVRRDQGLPMPQIDHPLMQTGLGTLPEVMPRGEDELLEKVAAKVCSDFGLTELWK